MVQCGDFEVQVIRAKDETPFPEHGRSKNGCRKIAIEPNDQYFVQVSHRSKTKFPSRSNYFWNMAPGVQWDASIRVNNDLWLSTEWLSRGKKLLAGLEYKRKDQEGLAALSFTQSSSTASKIGNLSGAELLGTITIEIREYKDTAVKQHSDVDFFGPELFEEALERISKSKGKPVLEKKLVHSDHGGLVRIIRETLPRVQHDTKTIQVVFHCVPTHTLRARRTTPREKNSIIPSSAIVVSSNMKNRQALVKPKRKQSPTNTSLQKHALRQSTRQKKPTLCQSGAVFGA